MAYSYNGWYASPNLRTRPLVVAGESFSPGVLDNDDVYAVFCDLAEFLHEHVEPIVRDDWHQADDWGYYYRPTTGGTSLSCHASATAIDYNATRHPYGVRGTWEPWQIRKVDAYLRDVLGGVVRWGEHYSTNVDGMHFEINDTPAAVARIAAQLGDDMPAYRDWQPADRRALATDVADEVQRRTKQDRRRIRRLVRYLRSAMKQQGLKVPKARSRK